MLRIYLGPRTACMPLSVEPGVCRMNLQVQVRVRIGQGKARHLYETVFLSCVKSSIADGARDRKEASRESRIALSIPSAPADGPPRQGRRRRGKEKKEKKGKPRQVIEKRKRMVGLVGATPHSGGMYAMSTCILYVRACMYCRWAHCQHLATGSMVTRGPREETMDNNGPDRCQSRRW